MASQGSGASALKTFAAEELGVELPSAAANGSGPEQGFVRSRYEERGRLYLGRRAPANDAGCRDDVELLRRCRADGHFVRLLSVPGTGKSAALEAAFGEELITVVCSEGTEEAHLIGGYRPRPGGEFDWAYGPVAAAMKEGRPIVLDEVSAAPPRVLTRLNGVFDGRLELVVDEHEGEVIRAQDGFFCALAYNPDIMGFELSPALESRFALAIHYSTDYDAALELGINRAMVDVARALDVQRIGGEADWAPQMRELIAFAAAERSFGTEFALRALLSAAPEEARAALAAEIESHSAFDPEAVKELTL